MATPNAACNSRSTIRNLRSSFTLIELLVVVAIISILAAMLLPALKNARETTKRMACLQHEKQLGVALLIMAGDNEGWINGTGSSSAPSFVAWYDSITNGYLGNDILIRYSSNTACPSKNSKNVHWGYRPYGVNNMFSGSGYEPVHSIFETKNASRVFLVAETYDDFADGGFGFDNYIFQPYAVHQGKGLNFYFVDGHSEFLKVIGADADNDSPWWRTQPSATDWPPYNNMGSWPPPDYYSGLWAD